MKETSAIDLLPFSAEEIKEHEDTVRDAIETLVDMQDRLGEENPFPGETIIGICARLAYLRQFLKLIYAEEEEEKNLQGVK